MLTRTAAFVALPLSARTLLGVRLARFLYAYFWSGNFGAGKLTAGRGFEKVEVHALRRHAEQVHAVFRDAIYKGH
jgi:hypothetical protein